MNVPLDLLSTTVGKLVKENPDLTTIFDKYDIDYCCGGKFTLGEACKSASIDPNIIVSQISAIDASCDKSNKNSSEKSKKQVLKNMSVPDLTRYIVDTYHAYSKANIDGLTQLIFKVTNVHASLHPELVKIQAEWQAIIADISIHMLHEENSIFPEMNNLFLSIERNLILEQDKILKLKNEINKLIAEHEILGEHIKNIKTYSNNYAIPENACLSYTKMYQTLKVFIENTIQHVHTENNILFPKILEMLLKFNA